MRSACISRAFCSPVVACGLACHRHCAVGGLPACSSVGASGDMMPEGATAATDGMYNDSADGMFR